MKAFELVLVGHPDKVCDGIAEAIRAANLDGRNAIEVCWFNNLIVIGGETDKEWNIDELGEIVFNYLLNIVGMTEKEMQMMMVDSRLQRQSVEINEAVGEDGCGDNGIFFGGWNSTLSPLIFKLKKMVKKMTHELLSEWGYRTDGKLLFLVNDSGSVIDVNINIASYEGVKPNSDALRKFIGSWTNCSTTFVNPKGDWHKCFAFADAGLTNRKIACDTQCGLFRLGGGGLMGKDDTKSDRTLNVYLTQLAKKICEDTGLRELELHTFCTIGKTKIQVFDRSGNCLRALSYKDVKIDCLEIDIFGGIECFG